MEDLRFDRWCHALGCLGAAVEYRLAPETRYPGPLEDCYAGLRWLHDHAEALGIDVGRTGIMGTSAGGALAAGLALSARDRGELPIAFQLLLYPTLDDRQQTVTSRWPAPIADPALVTYAWRSYLGDLFGTDRVPAPAAPARADDLGGLPPCLICVGSADGLCDEAMTYAKRLNHAGVPTELHVYPGAPHGFDVFMPGSALSRRFERDVSEWLAGQFGAGP